MVYTSLVVLLLVLASLCIGFPAVSTGTPTQPYLIQDNLTQLAHPSPASLLLPLRVDQQRSLHWMLRREHPADTPDTIIDTDHDLVQGVVIHSSKLSVPPLTRVRVDWRLAVSSRLRGGVLADSMGFGEFIYGDN